MPLNPLIKNLIFISMFYASASCNFNSNTPPVTHISDSTEQANTAKELSRQIESDPENAELYYKRGQIYLNEKYLERAEADVEKAIMLDSVNPLYHFNLARITYAMNKTKLAALHYEKALLFKTDYLDAKLKLADLYFLVKEHQKSVNLLNNALKQDKNNAYIYHMLGMNFKETGDTARAIFHFQTAIETDPTDYESTLYIANLYAAQNNRIAFDYYNAALKIRPKSVEVLFARAVMAQKKLMYKQALIDYRRVITLDPANYLSYYNVGYINFDNKMFAEALRNWDICTQMNPGYAKAYYMKALTQEITGNKKEAKINYKQAIELEPQNELFLSGLNRK